MNDRAKIKDTQEMQQKMPATTGQPPTVPMTSRELQEMIRSTLREFTSGTAYWTCRNGHPAPATLFLHESGSLIHVSDWEDCDRCFAEPSTPQVIRMHFDIIGQWLQDRNISQDTYRELASKCLKWGQKPGAVPVMH